MAAVEFLHADWPALPGIVAGTTLRRGGVSRNVYSSLNLGAYVDDEPSAVAENRRRLSAHLKLPSHPVWLRQVHGNRVVVAPLAEAEPDADACVTAEPGVVCAVLTADCLPVLFASRDGSTIAAAHAGWRGLAAGVLSRTVDALGCAPDTVCVWLGPAIAQPAFEVGAEVRTAFLARRAAAKACFEPNDRGRWQADLYGLARQELNALGVTEIYGGDRCTYTQAADFFSHRRDGPCGRMASVIYRCD